MIDAFGVEREPGSAFVEQGERDSTGMYALIRYPDGSGLWRFRDRDNTFEAAGEKYSSVRSFRKAVMYGHVPLASGLTVRIVPSTTSAPTEGSSWLDTMGHLIGTAVIMIPIAAASYGVWMVLGLI